jgi:hypothetical protein
MGKWMTPVTDKRPVTRTMPWEKTRCTTIPLPNPNPDRNPGKRGREDGNNTEEKGPR